MIQKYAKLFSASVPLVWGMSYLFMALGASEIPAIELVALRCGLAFVALVLLFFRHLQKTFSWKMMIYSAFAGLLLFAVFYGLVVGVVDTSASTAGFLASTTVVIVPIIQAMMTRKIPDLKTIVAILIVLSGLFLLTGADLSQFNFGAIMCLMAAALYAIYIILSKYFIERVDAMSLGIWQLGFASLYALVGTLALERSVLPHSGTIWAAVLGLALICSAYGWVMQTIVQAYVSAEFTSFMFSLEPIFTAFFALLFFGEWLSSLAYLGTILIFIGVLLVTYQPKKDKQSILLQEKVNY
ncbi:EamA/RhaT family transporter [Streptococcus macedonicus]|uniref:EamA-like transporter family n=2 Tax=Streptococcus TaxID=1301 RepID=A0A380K185_9STRE|nr:DMT family transporter [Streptococcus macedonicus]CCF02961.1 Permease of the drug/metabolite transporter (DMT) superfamily [Streptococcus macedonicus ACA-DC 198]SUN58465.1 EamA-like transporter family [Streptococcus gallolyticus]KEH51755.1 membrane protein [Streptococcus macedonicus]MBT1047539.1 DMT family transporter [Streptococcus macedonicus]MCW8644850.1 DMT family transporter [Streptococcus macedonicus]